MLEGVPAGIRPGSVPTNSRILLDDRHDPKRDLVFQL